MPFRVQSLVSSQIVACPQGCVDLPPQNQTAKFINPEAGYEGAEQDPVQDRSASCIIWAHECTTHIYLGYEYIKPFYHLFSLDLSRPCQDIGPDLMDVSRGKPKSLDLNLT